MFPQVLQGHALYARSCVPCGIARTTRGVTFSASLLNHFFRFSAPDRFSLRLYQMIATPHIHLTRVFRCALQMSIATVERSRATFHIKRGLRFSHCYFIRAVHSAPEKVAFAPVKFSRCFGRCFRSAFRLALCARTVYAVVHRSFALSALYGSHRTRARRNARYTRSDIAPTFGVHVRGAMPDACPRNAVRGDYDYSQGGHLTEFNRPSHRAECVTVKRLTAQAGYRALRRGCCLGRPSWSVSIIHLGASHVNTFFQKILGGNFFSFF